MSAPPLSPLSRFGIVLLVAGAVVVFGMLGLLKRLPSSHPAEKAKRRVHSDSTMGAGASVVSPAMDGRAASVAELTQTIERALAVLNDPAIVDKTSALKALREALAKMDPAAGIAAVRQFLAGGRDGVTGERFKVGSGGILQSAPTLRTLLMDQLGTWSNQTHAADAAEVARQVLNTKGSPDEWAVSLRNLAWNDPEGSKATLAAKARDLITYPPWQQAPTAGYMEAFDSAAYSGDPTLLEVLAPLGKDPSPVRQPALVALDRLSATAPGAVAEYLNAHPGLLSDRPLMRADYMGKVDLSDAAQKAEAEAYLQRADVTLPEKTKFLARLAVPAGFVSNNLLTPPTPPVTPIIERRALVNQAAAAWLQSGQYPTLQAPLQTLIEDTQPQAGGL